MNTPNQNTTLDSGRPTRIGGALDRMLSRRIHPPDKPYIQTPGQNMNNLGQHASDDYSETEVDVEQIAGYSITFGSQKTLHVDADGKVHDLSQKPHYIIGSGRRVSDMQDIAGICPFCQAQAMKAYEEGTVTIQQAQLLSLFDAPSSSQCSICGLNTCSVHCRPIQLPEEVVSVCVACQDKIKREERRKRIIRFLTAPFIMLLRFFIEISKDDK